MVEPSCGLRLVTLWSVDCWLFFQMLTKHSVVSILIKIYQMLTSCPEDIHENEPVTVIYYLCWNILKYTLDNIKDPSRKDCWFNTDFKGSPGFFDFLFFLNSAIFVKRPLGCSHLLSLTIASLVQFGPWDLFTGGKALLSQHIWPVSSH